METPGFSRKWLVAVRPFALPASTMPVIFGSVAAVTISQSPFQPVLFLAALISMAVLHSGANLLNDVFDYRQGLDTNVHPGSGAVVRKWVPARTAHAVAWLLLLLGIVIGCWIVWQVGWAVFWIGVVGVTIGVIYTWGPFELKSHGLGDFAVFLNFGVLGALGAWTVQTGNLSWVPVIWAVPMSILVSGILHANNWRDIDSDMKGGIATVANVLGDHGSSVYYRFLIFSPFVLIAALLLLTRVNGFGPPMPWTLSITLIALPKAIGLNKTAAHRATQSGSNAFRALDASTAQLNLVFGALCTAALGLDYWLDTILDSA